MKVEKGVEVLKDVVLYWKYKELLSRAVGSCCALLEM
jgi:hypothetical protein